MGRFLGVKTYVFLECGPFLLLCVYLVLGEFFCVYGQRTLGMLAGGGATVGGLCFFAVLVTVLLVMANIVTRGGTGFRPTGLGKV